MPTKQWPNNFHFFQRFHQSAGTLNFNRMNLVFKINTLVYAMACITVLLSSCEQSIDIELPAQEEKLVIYGMLNNQNVPNVMISKTVNIYEYQNQTDYNLKPIESATIKVFNSQDTLIQNEPFFNEEGIAVFLFPNTFNIVPGDTYYLEVEADGKTAKAKTVVPEEITASDFEVNLDTVSEFNYAFLSSYVSFNAEDIDFNNGGLQTKTILEYLRYETVYEYDSLYNEYISYEDSFEVQDIFFSLIDNDVFVEEEQLKSYFFLPYYYRNVFVEDYPYYYYDDKKPAVDFDLHFFITNFNEDLLTYFNSVDAQQATISNPFAEPALIRGNIEGGLGVFGASYTNPVPFTETFRCCE